MEQSGRFPVRPPDAEQNVLRRSSPFRSRTVWTGRRKVEPPSAVEVGLQAGLAGGRGDPPVGPDAAGAPSPSWKGRGGRGVSPPKHQNAGRDPTRVRGVTPR